MKFLSVLLAAAALTVPVNAQYFSEGWKPGQPVVREAPSTATFIPQAVPTAKSVNSDGNIGPSPFNLTNFLTTGPVASIASKLGVNMTERLERARRELEMWDPRIPLITDNNYWSLIVNETMTPDEEVERVWFLIVYVFVSFLLPLLVAHPRTLARYRLVETVLSQGWRMTISIAHSTSQLLRTIFQMSDGDASTISMSPISRRSGRYGSESCHALISTMSHFFVLQSAVPGCFEGPGGDSALL